MRISIIGAGPVGLLLSCLLADKHKITIYEKREYETRSHNFIIDNDTIKAIQSAIKNQPKYEQLYNTLGTWINTPVNIIDIENFLINTAIELGVIIHRNRYISSLDEIQDNIIIAANGAKSNIRTLIFGDVVDTHTVSYMALLKYQTPGHTTPRIKLSEKASWLLNGLSGPDMVLDFESLQPPNDVLRKTGVLHIPISKTTYDILTQDNRGTYNNPWTLEEIQRYNHPKIAKLSRIIGRYNFSLRWRKGWLEDAKITAIPLTIYRSEDVIKIVNNKLVILVGDASSGLIYQRGLSKGWLEAVKCAELLDTKNIIEYPYYCRKLYESERDIVLNKNNKIVSTNQTIAAGSVVAVASIGLLLLGCMLK